MLDPHATDIRLIGVAALIARSTWNGSPISPLTVTEISSHSPNGLLDDSEYLLGLTIGLQITAVHGDE